VHRLNSRLNRQSAVGLTTPRACRDGPGGWIRFHVVGRQYPTAVGTIDLLAKDAEGIYVVIELKRGRTSDRVIGQIARYLTWVAQRLGRGKESSVRGIIVGQDFDKHFDAALSN
jgi:RecB family endonuclease NucS